MNRKMSSKLVFVCMILSLMLVVSCGKKKVDTGADAATTTTTDDSAAAAGGDAASSDDSAVAGSSDSASDEGAASVSGTDRDAAREAGDAAAEAMDATNNVYFDFDSSDILDSQRTTLEAKAAWMKANPNAKLTIEGHCDERGTSEYNLALGDRRAARAKGFLKKLGVSSDRMDTVSYGEEKPAVVGHNEEAWSKNRRAYLQGR